MSSIFKCYQCATEFPEKISIRNYKKYMRNVPGTLYKKPFCCDKCYKEYLIKRQVDQYNDMPIYKIILDGKKYFVPYIKSFYAFKNIEDCKKRMSMKNVSVVYQEMLARHNQMMFGD